MVPERDDQEKKEGSCCPIAGPDVWPGQPYMNLVLAILTLMGVIFCVVSLSMGVNLLIGEVLIGLVAGITFWSEAISCCKRLSGLFDMQRIFKAIIFVGTALGVFLIAPTLVISVVVGVGIRALIGPRRKA